MSLLLLILATVFCGAHTFLNKPASDNCKTVSSIQLYNGCFSFVAMLGGLTAVLINGSFYIPLSGLFASMLFGLTFALTILACLLLMKNGPASLSSLFTNFSLLLTVIFSICFLNDKLTWLKAGGVVLLVVWLLLFSNPKLAGEKLPKKWWILAFTSMIINSVLCLISKIYGMKSGNAYCYAYTFYGYMFAALFSFLISFILRKGETQRGIKQESIFYPKMSLLMIGNGLTNFGLNLSVTLLATRMNASIVYPVVQGCCPIIVAIGAALLLKEKMPPRKIIAIIAGVAAIVLLSI